MNINKMLLCVGLVLFSQTIFGMDLNLKKTAMVELNSELQQMSICFFEQTCENDTIYKGKFEILRKDTGQVYHTLRMQNDSVQELDYFLYQEIDPQTAISFFARQYSIRRQQLMLEGNDTNKLGISLANPLDTSKRILVYPDYHNAICFLDDVREQSLEQ